MPTAPTIDYAPLLLALAGMLTSFGALTVWYIRTTVTKQAAMLDKALQHNAQLATAMSTTRVQNAILSERNQQMAQDIKDLQRAIKQCQDDLVALRDQRENEREAYDRRALQYQNEIVERDQTIKALRAEIAGLRTRLDDISQRLNQINSDYILVVSERDQLRNDKAALAKEVADLQAEISAVTKHNSQLDETVRKLRVDLDALRAQSPDKLEAEL